MKKVLIFDSSTLISLTMNGLLPELKELWRQFGGYFIITRDVKYESVDHPLKIQRFELEALQLQSLLDQKVLVLPSALGINDEEISKRTSKILQETNTLFQANGKPVHLIDLGEASCLALQDILSEEEYTSAIVVDERTTRLLGERPENLHRLMEHKLHMPIQKMHGFPDFQKYLFLRSAELMYVAYKKNLTILKGQKVLSAMLYGVKFKGCAISEEEIDILKRL